MLDWRRYDYIEMLFPNGKKKKIILPFFFKIIKILKNNIKNIHFNMINLRSEFDALLSRDLGFRR